MPSDTSPTVQYSHALAAPSASYPLTVAHFLLLTLCRRLQLLTLCLWYHLQLQLLTLSQSPGGAFRFSPSGGAFNCSLSGSSLLPSGGAFNCVFSVPGGAFNCNSISTSASASGGDFNCSLTVAEKSCEHLSSQHFVGLGLDGGSGSGSRAEAAVVTAGAVARRRAGGFFDLKFIGIVRRLSRSMTASG
jgi:hypothetical protein